MSKHYDSHNAGPEWATPDYIWKPLADAIGGFDLDPATGAESEPIAPVCYTLDPNAVQGTVVERSTEHKRIAQDGLAAEWSGDVWVNPPYGRSYNKPWAEKFSKEVERGDVDTITALLPASMSTNWWHNNYAEHGDYFTFIDHRVSFTGAESGNASFASVIVTFGDVSDEYLDECKKLGQVVEAVYQNS